jgi:hypothetical protein
MKGSAMRLRLFLWSAVSVLVLASRAHAQGCALCYTTASAAGAAAQRSLNWGIFALLAPALVLFLSVMILLYRRAVSSAA